MTAPAFCALCAASMPEGSDQLTSDMAAVDRSGVLMRVPTGAPGEFISRLEDEAELSEECDEGLLPQYVSRLPSGALRFWGAMSMKLADAYVEGEGRAAELLAWTDSDGGEPLPMHEQARRVVLARRVFEDLIISCGGRMTPEATGFVNVASMRIAGLL